MFNHLLVTRFNLRNPEWDLTKKEEEDNEDQIKLF